MGEIGEMLPREQNQQTVTSPENRKYNPEILKSDHSRSKFEAPKTTALVRGIITDIRKTLSGGQEDLSPELLGKAFENDINFSHLRSIRDTEEEDIQDQQKEYMHNHPEFKQNDQIKYMFGKQIDEIKGMKSNIDALFEQKADAEQLREVRRFIYRHTLNWQLHAEDEKDPQKKGGASENELVFTTLLKKVDKQTLSTETEEYLKISAEKLQTELDELDGANEVDAQREQGFKKFGENEKEIDKEIAEPKAAALDEYIKKTWPEADGSPESYNWQNAQGFAESESQAVMDEYKKYLGISTPPFESHGYDKDWEAVTQWVTENVQGIPEFSSEKNIQKVIDGFKKAHLLPATVMTLLSKEYIDKKEEIAGDMKASIFLEKLAELDDMTVLLQNMAKNINVTKDPGEYEKIRTYIESHRTAYEQHSTSESDEQKRTELSANAAIFDTYMEKLKDFAQKSAVKKGAKRLQQKVGNLKNRLTKQT